MKFQELSVSPLIKCRFVSAPVSSLSVAILVHLGSSIDAQDYLVYFKSIPARWET